MNRMSQFQNCGDRLAASAEIPSALVPMQSMGTKACRSFSICWQY